MPKRPVEAAVIDGLGVVGDLQSDTENHGGPNRALCLFSLEVIESFQAEGHPIEPGFAGENLTLSGIDWETVVPGARLGIGAVVEIEVTTYAAPCSKNAAWFKEGTFGRMLQSRYPGSSRVYARVLTGGAVATGDEVRLLD